MSQITTQRSSVTEEPLSPLNMIRAGVSARDVIWYRRLKGGQKFKELQSDRGNAILQKVREHNMRMTDVGSVPMPA